MGKKVGVVLAGCGVYDGTEIHEAVLTLLALDQRGATAVMAAPDKEQAHVINHRTGEVDPTPRNVLVEAARIARGKVRPLAELHAADIDALIFPGGFGAAKNLGSFAFDGAAMTVDPDVARLVAEVRAAKKPIGFLCIAPTLAAKLIPGVKVTLGCAGDASVAAEAMGAEHVETEVHEIVIDDEHNVVSTSAYMLGPWVASVHKGIDALVEEVLARA
jgi:enhancing lycopene biosynthesis protein 2